MLTGVPVSLVIMCAYRSSNIVGHHVCLQEFQYCWSSCVLTGVPVLLVIMLTGVLVLLVIMCAYRSSSVVSDYVCLHECQCCQ